MRATAVLVTLVAAMGCSAAASHPNTSPTSPKTSIASTPAGASAAARAFPDWITYHGDLLRSGVSATMPAASGNPVLAKSIKLDGAVYASPIVANTNTIVVTENDTVYSFNSANTQMWKTHVGTPSPASERPCGDIDPLGITGTPIYSRVNATVYVVAEIHRTTGPVHQLVALDAATGAVKFRVSVDLPGVTTAAMQQRGALTIVGGKVWVPFGGLAGDCSNYKGRVVGVNLDGTGSPIAYTVPTTREAGIWTPPGPTVYQLHLYVAVGNGESGVGDPYDFSDSVLELNTRAQLVDSFSPSTWPADNDADLDLGSQGPAIVDGKWVYADGKSGTAYVLALGHLGGIGGQVSSATVCKSFGGTAVSGSTVYVPCTDGVRAVTIDSTGHMTVPWHVSQSSIVGSPVVGGGRVWSLDPGAGVLYGLNPATGTAVEHITVGQTSRFATPALSGNRVLIGTLTGLVVVTTS